MSEGISEQLLQDWQTLYTGIRPWPVDKLVVCLTGRSTSVLPSAQERRAIWVSICPSAYNNHKDKQPLRLSIVCWHKIRMEAPMVFTSRLPRLHQREAPCVICYCFTFLVLKWQQVPAKQKQKCFCVSSPELSEKSLVMGWTYESSFDETDK